MDIRGIEVTNQLRVSERFTLLPDYTYTVLFALLCSIISDVELWRIIDKSPFNVSCCMIALLLGFDNLHITIIAVLYGSYTFDMTLD